MERKELLKKVAYLTDNVNKKIRSFSNNNLGGYYNYMLNKATEDYADKIALTTTSGYLTKGKKELGKLNDEDLQGLYDNLKKLQTSDTHSTPTKFKKYEEGNLHKSAAAIKEIIGEKRFKSIQGKQSEADIVIEFIRRKEEELEKEGSTYSSSQILVDMAIEHPINAKDKKALTRTAEVMEKARKLINRNTIDMESRRKNGNR
jgi:hypothetical protein